MPAPWRAQPAHLTPAHPNRVRPAGCRRDSGVSPAPSWCHHGLNVLRQCGVATALERFQRMMASGQWCRLHRPRLAVSYPDASPKQRCGPYSASGDLGQHRGLPVTAIVTIPLQDLESGSGLALTGGGSTIPMEVAIRDGCPCPPLPLHLRPEVRPTSLSGPQPAAGLGRPANRAARHRRWIHGAWLRPIGIPRPGAPPRRVVVGRHYRHRQAHLGVSRRQPVRRPIPRTMAGTPPLRRGITRSNTVVSTKIRRPEPTTQIELATSTAETTQTRTRRGMSGAD